MGLTSRPAGLPPCAETPLLLTRRRFHLPRSPSRPILRHRIPGTSSLLSSPPGLPAVPSPAPPTPSWDMAEPRPPLLSSQPGCSLPNHHSSCTWAAGRPGRPSLQGSAPVAPHRSRLRMSLQAPTCTPSTLHGPPLSPLPSPSPSFQPRPQPAPDSKPQPPQDPPWPDPFPPNGPWPLHISL